MADPNEIAPSAEARYAQAVAKLKESRRPKTEASAAARRERDLAELEAVYAAIDLIDGNDEDNLLKVPDAPPGCVGHIVVRRPKPGEIARFKTVVLKGTSVNPERGSTELRVKANEALVASCLAYPSLDRFQELCEVAPSIPDAAARLCHRLAEAGAHNDAKE